MQKFRQFAELLCRLTLNKSIATWTWSDNPGVANVASCGPSGHDAIDMAVNVGALGAEWFSDQPATCARNIDLLIHELGHHSGALDCTREHADEMTRIKGQLAAAKAARSIKDAEIDTKLQIARQKAEMIRKRQECKRPEVLAVLSPLTTPGYWLPKSRMPSEEKQPLSLSTIRSSGALARGREGLYALWLLGADKHDTLRPRWPYQGNFGHSVNTPESYEHLKRVQTYLIDYGDALVAEGCLSP